MAESELDVDALGASDWVGDFVPLVTVCEVDVAPNEPKEERVLRTVDQLGLSFGKSRERTSSGGRFSFSGRTSTEQKRGNEPEPQARRGSTEDDRLITEAASILNACQADIKELWELPAVRRMRDRRRFKLEEWAD